MDEVRYFDVESRMADHHDPQIGHLLINERRCCIPPTGSRRVAPQASPLQDVQMMAQDDSRKFWRVLIRM